jgi:nitrite reductase/ring-hydroxylating ferredoxin subunit
MTGVAESPATELNQRPQGSFDLAAGWWPIALGGELGLHPGRYELGNRALAVYRDRGGIVRAVEDSCPHRRLPLSMGRITEDGSLQCAYHGWCFDGATGKCTAIPNLQEDEKVPGSIRISAFATAENVADVLGWSLRTRLAPPVGPPTGEEPDEGTTMYATQERDGFVLIWTGDGEVEPPPPVRLPTDAATRTFWGQLELRAPHQRVAEAVLWNPGKALGLGLILGGGDELTSPEVDSDPMRVTVLRSRRLIELPRPHTYDSPLQRTVTTRTRMIADTGLAWVEVVGAARDPSPRVVIGVTPVGSYRTVLRWRGEIRRDAPAGFLAGRLAMAPRRLSGRGVAIAERLADATEQVADDGIDRLRDLREGDGEGETPELAMTGASANATEGGSE